MCVISKCCKNWGETASLHSYLCDDDAALACNKMIKINWESEYCSICTIRTDYFFFSTFSLVSLCELNVFKVDLMCFYVIYSDVTLMLTQVSVTHHWHTSAHIKQLNMMFVMFITVQRTLSLEGFWRVMWSTVLWFDWFSGSFMCLHACRISQMTQSTWKHVDPYV